MSKHTKLFAAMLVFTMIFTGLVSNPASAQGTLSGNLRVWMQKANQDQLEKTVLPDFLKANPGVTVEFVNYSPQETANQLVLAIQGGTGAPDVALMESAQVARVVDLGGLVDLTDRLQPHLGDLPESQLQHGMKDGRYYSMVWDTGPTVLYYRRDIFKAAGLADDPAEVDKLVATWDTFLETCKTIKAKTGLPCFASNKANNNDNLWTSVLLSRGLGWIGKDGNLTVDSPEAVATLEKLGEFWKADVVSDDAYWTDQWYASLNMVKLDDEKVKPVATIPIAAWMGGFLTNWAAKDAAGLWGVAKWPAYEAGGIRASNMGGSSYVIPDQTKQADLAWAFVDYVNSTASQVALFKYGDVFPARFSTYADPIFTEKLSYFADQAVRQVYAEAAKEVSGVSIVSANFPLIQSRTTTAIQKYATGQMSAQDALKEAAEQIRLETGLK